MTHVVRKMDELNIGILLRLVMKDPSALLQELAVSMRTYSDKQWTEVDVYRGLRELGFVRVKIAQHAKEADAAKQAAFREIIGRLHVGPEHMVFIDEVSTDSRVVNRPYAWAMKGFKICTETIFMRGRRFSSIAAISADGIVGEPLIVEGAVTQDIFSYWFLKQVLPDVGRYPGDKHCVVIMDNCAIHSKEFLKDVCSCVGALAVFLPPYSPIFNPIEKMFGKLKQFFKSSRELISSVPPMVAIKTGFSTITASDCEAWIRGVECYNTEYTADS